MLRFTAVLLVTLLSIPVVALGAGPASNYGSWEYTYDAEDKTSMGVTRPMDGGFLSFACNMVEQRCFLYVVLPDTKCTEGSSFQTLWSGGRKTAYSDVRCQTSFSDSGAAMLLVVEDKLIMSLMNISNVVGLVRATDDGAFTVSRFPVDGVTDMLSRAVRDMENYSARNPKMKNGSPAAEKL